MNKKPDKCRHGDDPAKCISCEMLRLKKPDAITDLTTSQGKIILAAVEFGFLCRESGFDMTRTLDEARKLLNQTLYKDALAEAFDNAKERIQ